MTASLDQDLRDIRNVNQRDVDAALASDLSAMVALWSEDFTVLPPVGPIIRGRSANEAKARQGMDLIRSFEPVEHVVEFEEIRVAGDYAFEWGSYRGMSRPRAGGAPMRYSGKVMRILQRQLDGSWKMYRTIATNDPPETK